MPSFAAAAVAAAAAAAVVVVAAAVAVAAACCFVCIASTPIDPPTMEILLQLNESRGFVIEVLSGEFVLCSESVCDFLEEEVTRRLELAERPLLEVQKEMQRQSGGEGGME
ncbi:hypothetical protein Efla_003938 [Eimeria flavescens]